MSFFAVLCLCGCGAPQPASITQQQAQTALSQPFQAKVSVQTPDITVEGQLERTGPEVYRFTVQQPEQLNGLCISVEQQTCRLGYQGMELELQTDTLPGGFSLVLFNKALDGMARQQELTLQNTGDGGGVIAGKVDENSFELKLDRQGRILSFSVPKQELLISWLYESA